MPALEKVCDTFAKVAVVVLNQGVPSPNDQFHMVGVLVEVSLNCTVSEAVPVVGVPEKLATGAEDPVATDTFTHVT